jgi:hypothetical protein
VETPAQTSSPFEGEAAASAAPVASVEDMRDRIAGPQKHGSMSLQWPGLGAVETEGQRPVSPASFGPPIQPVKKSSWPQWCFALFLTAVCAGVTVLLVKQQRESRRAATSVIDGGTAALSQRDMIPAAIVDKPQDFVDNRIQRARSAESAETLLKRLFESPSLDEKAACVFPLHDREMISTFFESPSEGRAPGLIAMRELPQQPVLLPSRDSVTMFSVMTTRNNHGALLRLTEAPDGQARIFWPLFQETHDRVLTDHIERRVEEPCWFHVGFRKVHAFQLPESERAAYSAIDVDGSTDGSSHIVTYVPVNSPVGRYLSSEMDWGKLYLGRLLLNWMDIGGQRHLTILDCEGANIMGRELPAASNADSLPAVAK